MAGAESDDDEHGSGEEDRHYLRYMDDFLLLAADRREARERLVAVRTFLAERLRLELNPRRVIVAPLGEPCDWLGYVHYAGGRSRVRRRSVRRLWRRLPALERRVAAGAIDRDVRASVASWFGLAKHADAFRLSRRIFAERDVENIGKRLLVKSLPRRRSRTALGVGRHNTARVGESHWASRGGYCK